MYEPTTTTTTTTLCVGSPVSLRVCAASVGRHLTPVGIPARLYPCLSVCCHCCYHCCCRYISRYFSSVQGFSIWQLLPSRRTLAGCLLAAGCAAASNARLMSAQQLAVAGFWHQAALHVGVGVVCLAALGGCIVSGERDTMRQLLQLRRQGGQPAAANSSSSSKED